MVRNGPNLKPRQRTFARFVCLSLRASPRASRVDLEIPEMSAMPAMPAFTSSGGALIASPDSALRQQVLHRLNGRCRPVQQALGGADALAKLEKGNWQVLFLDRRLPDLDAEELIAIIGRRFPEIQVVLLDADGAGFGAERVCE